MKLTLLGSGDAIGMPVPMCNCEYCQKSQPRRRPGLLIQTNKTTLVFEISPDIKNQLHKTNTYDADAFFITHHHYDHFSGIRELNHIAINKHVLNEEQFEYNGWHGRQIQIYLNSKTKEHLKNTAPHIHKNENIQLNQFQPNNKITIGNVTVQPFTVEHADQTQGYIIQHNNTKVVYAPDARNIPEQKNNQNIYKNPEIAILEGTVFQAESHGHTNEIKQNINQVNADRTVLVNLNEHLEQTHTSQLKQKATEMGYEIWEDFQSETI